MTYIVIISFYSAYYIARKLGKLGANSVVVFVTVMLVLCICAGALPRVFVVSLGKIVRAQACSMYHKNSLNIPPECRKFVRL